MLSTAAQPDQPSETPSRQDPIVIATSSDMAYLPFALVVLESIARTANRNRPIEFHLLYDGPDHWALEQLRRFKRRPIEVIIHRVANPFGVLGEINAFPPSTFFRHAIPDVLAHHDRALYLDLDIIVQLDLGPLFDADLKGNVIGGAPCTNTIIGALLSPHFGALPGDPLNYHWRWYFREILGQTRDEDFINFVQCGILLIDLELHRRMRLDQQMLSTAIEMQGRLYHAQQGVLNKLLIGKMTLLDPKWNRPAESLFPEKEAMAPPMMRDMVRRQRLEPGILHFGGKKPWFFHDLPGAREWWSAALRSKARWFAVGLWWGHAWKATSIRALRTGQWISAKLTRTARLVDVPWGLLTRSVSFALQRLQATLPEPYAAARSVFRAILPRRKPSDDDIDRRD
ncbi:MAG: glycosyltransferase family 8 protein [Devosia sp.]